MADPETEGSLRTVRALLVNHSFHQNVLTIGNHQGTSDFLAIDLGNTINRIVLQRCACFCVNTNLHLTESTGSIQRGVTLGIMPV